MVPLARVVSVMLWGYLASKLPTHLSSPPDMKLSPPLAYSAMYSLSLLDGLI